jgi:hypothetical protein
VAAFEDEWLLMQQGYARPSVLRRVRRAAARALAVIPGRSRRSLQIEPETFR